MEYGLFLHYGLYSILEGSYEGRETPFYAEWIQHSLGIDNEVYAKLKESFDPLQFDAEELVEKAISYGFNYLVLTAKHHEGFCLFKSQVTDYTSVCACGRDLLKELSMACKKKNFPLGLYYSQAQDWHHGGYRAYEKRPQSFESYFQEICLPQVEELLTHYGAIKLLWFDTPMDMKEEETRALQNLVKKLQPKCQISGRIGRGLGDYLVTGDNMLPSQSFPGVWEVPMSLSTSWGYRKKDQWKSPKELLQNISKVYLRGGRVLLNVGPKADFSFPKEALERLEVLKAPMRALPKLLNKERVIYPFDDPGLLLFKEGNTLFLLLLDERKKVGLYNLLSSAEKVEVEGEEIPFLQSQSLEGDPYLGIRLPEQGCCLVEIQCKEDVAFLPFGHPLY